MTHDPKQKDIRAFFRVADTKDSKKSNGGIRAFFQVENAKDSTGSDPQEVRDTKH